MSSPSHWPWRHPGIYCYIIAATAVTSSRANDSICYRFNFCTLSDRLNKMPRYDSEVWRSDRLSGKDLLAKIVQAEEVHTEANVINWMRQICQGVAHMHKNNIIHLDLRVKRSRLTTLITSYIHHLHQEIYLDDQTRTKLQITGDSRPANCKSSTIYD